MEPFQEELKRIVTFLNQNDPQARKLWKVISALRGPDKNDDDKYATTSVLRRAIGLNHEDLIVLSDSEAAAEIRREKYPIDEYGFAKHSAHFAEHIVDAFRALGLKWNEVNEDLVIKRFRVE